MIKKNMPAEEYFSIEAASNSFNRLLLKHLGSPLNAKIERDRFSQSPQMKLGSAFHCAVLEPERFRSDYVIAPADVPSRPTERQLSAKNPSKETMASIEFWANFDSFHKGKTIISRSDADLIENMGGSLLDHVESRFLLDCPYEPEVTAISYGEEANKKCRIDLLVQDQILGDLKTTSDITDEGLSRSIYQYGYFMQSPWYLDIAAEQGLDARLFLFVFVLSTPPFSVRVVEIDRKDIIHGRRCNEKAFKIYADCIKNKAWTDYEYGISSIGLPGYAYRQIEHTLSKMSEE